jgi:hypothetical protein
VLAPWCAIWSDIKKWSGYWNEFCIISWRWRCWSLEVLGEQERHKLLISSIVR